MMLVMALTWYVRVYALYTEEVKDKEDKVVGTALKIGKDKTFANFVYTQPTAKDALSVSEINGLYGTSSVFDFEKDLNGNPIDGVAINATEIKGETDGFVNIRLNNGKYLVVDSTVWTNSVNKNEYWKLTTDALPTEIADNDEKSAALEDVELLENGRSADFYAFKIKLNIAEGYKMTIYPKAVPTYSNDDEKRGEQTAFSFGTETTSRALVYGKFADSKEVLAATKVVATGDNLKDAVATFGVVEAPDALDTDNIFVTKNEEVISGTIKLMNEECAYEDNADTYASKVRFVPEVPFLTTDEITLTVSRKVKSYAGIQMESDYIQAFDIEKEVRSIVADSLIKVAYHGSKQITVSTLPFDAAIGKKLVARSSSSMITAITEEAVLDENGQATLTLTGELPGTSVIIYSIEDVDVQGMSVINVIDGESLQTATPVASRVSGTAVYRNTQVALTCETEGAVIYYTTDESCPCDENGTRQVYTDPIAITEDMTIKAVAVAEDREESEIARRRRCWCRNRNCGLR